MHDDDVIDIHMTFTSRCWAADCWHVNCRCGWELLGFDTIDLAREAGDAHLAQANGWGEPA